MRDSQNEKCPTFAGSSISENIHLDSVNGLQVNTVNGPVNIHRFVCRALADHQNLLERYTPIECLDYQELDYKLHRYLLRKELIQQQDGGAHAEL